MSVVAYLSQNHSEANKICAFKHISSKEIAVLKMPVITLCWKVPKII